MNVPHPVTSVSEYRHADHGALQSLLTVREIMTPREHFICALESEPVRNAFLGVDEIYDALPVVRGTNRADAEAEVVGIIDRRRVAVQELGLRVSELMDEDEIEPIPLSTSLLEFARSLRGERLAIISDDAGRKIIGLVTSYDLARLPVRIALFAALTDLEEEIGNVVARFGGDPESWRRLLPKDNEELSRDYENGIRRATRRDDLGSPVLALTFGVKLALLEGLRDKGVVPGKEIPNLRKIRDMRNDIAHGVPFRDLAAVPQATRDLRQLNDFLKKFLGTSP